MKTVYILAHCYDEEFHDGCTDNQSIIGVFSSEEDAWRYANNNYSKDIAAEKARNEIAKVIIPLKNESRHEREQHGLALLEAYNKIAQFYGFVDWNELIGYDNVCIRTFKSTLIK